MKDYISIANDIKIALNINLFDKTRKTDNVDARSLYCYILNKDLKFTLHKIKDIFYEQGMLFDHSTIYYNVNLYDEVRGRKPHFDTIRDEALGKVEPKYLLIKRIENETSNEQLIQIQNCINEITNG